MSEETLAYIRQLRDFRTRKTALQALSRAGKDAVGDIVEAVRNERSVGAKWALVNLLGQLGDRRAVPALAECLEDPDYREVAYAALMSITGQDRGYSPQAWLDLPPEQAVAPAEIRQQSGAPTAALEPARILELAVKDLEAAVRQDDEDDFQVVLKLAGGRTQNVRVAFGKRDHEGEKIAIVYTECGPADPNLYETVLRKNMQMPYGAIAIRDIGGRPTFVMFNSMVREGLTPAALRKSIAILAERADKIERVVTKGKDNR